jgi:hypothetical protein
VRLFSAAALRRHSRSASERTRHRADRVVSAELGVGRAADPRARWQRLSPRELLFVSLPRAAQHFNIDVASNAVERLAFVRTPSRGLAAFHVAQAMVGLGLFSPVPHLLPTHPTRLTLFFCFGVSIRRGWRHRFVEAVAFVLGPLWSRTRSTALPLLAIAIDALPLGRPRLPDLAPLRRDAQETRGRSTFYGRADDRCDRDDAGARVLYKLGESQNSPRDQTLLEKAALGYRFDRQRASRTTRMRSSGRTVPAGRAKSTGISVQIERISGGEARDELLRAGEPIDRLLPVEQRDPLASLKDVA